MNGWLAAPRSMQCKKHRNISAMSPSKQPLTVMFEKVIIINCWTDTDALLVRRGGDSCAALSHALSFRNLILSLSNRWSAGASCFVEKLPVWWLQDPTDKSYKCVCTSDYLTSTELVALVADWTNWFYWWLQSTNRTSSIYSSFEPVKFFNYNFAFTC